MAEIKWIKLAANIFDNRKIKMIESMPDGASIVLIWLKLLCLAGSINDSGMVYFTTDIPYTDQMMATQFNMPLTTVQMALKTFEQFNMIETIDNILHISNWEKYQNIEGMEKIREQNRIRNIEYRARKKALEMLPEPSIEHHDVMHDITVISHDGTDIEEDKERRKKNKINKSIDPFDVYKTDNPYLFQALKEFESMRKQKKKPMSERAKSILLSKLGSFPEDQWIPVLYQSIEHSWDSIYPLKEDKPIQTKRNQDYHIGEFKPSDFEKLKHIGDFI